MADETETIWDRRTSRWEKSRSLCCKSARDRSLHCIMFQISLSEWRSWLMLAFCLCLISFKVGILSNVTPGVLKDAGKILIVDVQREWTPRIYQWPLPQPVVSKGSVGCWVVGTQISNGSPLTPENEPPFRTRFCSPRTTKLSKVSCNSTQSSNIRAPSLVRFQFE